MSLRTTTGYLCSLGPCRWIHGTSECLTSNSLIVRRAEQERKPYRQGSVNSPHPLPDALEQTSEKEGNRLAIQGVKSVPEEKTDSEDAKFR